MFSIFGKKKRGAQVEPGDELEKMDSLRSPGGLSHYRRDSAYLQEKQQQLFSGEEKLDWYDFLIHTQLCTMNYNPLELCDEERFDHVLRMMQNLKIHQTLKKNVKEIIPFVYDVYCLMRPNPYHNFIHVTDVSQYLYTLLLATHLAKRLRPIELTASFFAVLCHDLDHPGFTNAYQNNEKTELSERYQGKSPNEHHHVRCFELLVERHRLLENLETREERDRFYDVVRTLILATDMSKHTELVKRIKDNLGDDEKYNPLSTHHGVNLTLSIALKCADISNQARPWRVANRWNEFVYREFYSEGDKDREAGRSVPPLFDRETNEIPKSSVGFIGFVVAPLFEVFLAIMKRVADTNTVVDSSAVEECLFFLNQNKLRYQKLLDGQHVPRDEIEQELLAFSEDLRTEVCSSSDENPKKSLPGANANAVDGLSEMFTLKWLQKHGTPLTSAQLFHETSATHSSAQQPPSHPVADDLIVESATTAAPLKPKIEQRSQPPSTILHDHDECNHTSPPLQRSVSSLPMISTHDIEDDSAATNTNNAASTSAMPGSDQKEEAAKAEVKQTTP